MTVSYSVGFIWMLAVSSVSVIPSTQKADDAYIACATRSQADRAVIAVKQWLNERLKLQVSEEKTRVVNVKRHHSEFLGFKLKAERKAGK